MGKIEELDTWKGDDVGYSALHEWISKHKPKQEECSICNQPKKLELSNISGEYKRDINDFWWLCRSCHKIFDKERGIHRNGKKEK
ncbi:hypothetical protein LCGC14_1226840 [marine sediment metagenome]|uniref:HNH endonuclease n=1 Tax=marine sediment metagenome TaxID=412755 RepID=A0A0F9PE21_9ZZZZ